MALVLRSEKTEGQWVNFSVDGEEIGVKIRPLVDSVRSEIRSKHRKTQFVSNPNTKQMDRVVYHDEQAVSKEVLIHSIEDIRGVVGEDGNPVKVDDSMKLAVASLQADVTPEVEAELMKARQDMGEIKESAGDFPCPHCGGQVAIPEDYKSMPKKITLSLLILKRAGEMQAASQKSLEDRAGNS